MSDETTTLVARLRERAAFSRTAIAGTSDALHFEEAAARIQALEEALREWRRLREPIIEAVEEAVGYDRHHPDCMAVWEAVAVTDDLLGEPR
jgi:hypothetical protein